MIEESLIVNDIRKIRHSISEQYDNNPDLYIDYLLSKKSTVAKSPKGKVKMIKNSRLTSHSTGWGYRPAG